MQLDNFSIEESGSDGHVRLEFTGELDLAQTDKIRALLDEGRHLESVVVDTTGLTFIDSIGLASLFEIRERVGPERFTLIEGKATARLIDISGLRDYFS